MKTTNIYVLIDPRTGYVRYVGKANDVSQRYKAHLNRARKHQIHKSNWVELLKKEGLKPTIQVIDVVPIDEWVFWEMYWISQMKSWGFDLINYTMGGDGCTFGNQNSFKKGDKAKKVIGYDKNGSKVYEFNSAEDATKFFKTHRSSIPKCSSGKGKTLMGYAWFYENDIIDLIEEDLKNKIKNRFVKELKENTGYFKKGQKGIRSKKIKVINVKTNEILKFESGVEVGKYLKVSQPTISYGLLKCKLIKKTYKIEFYGN